MKAEERCPWNFKMKCTGVDCPLQDDGFFYLLEKWLYTVRTPLSRSLSFSDSRNHNLSEDLVLRKVEVARLFEQPERAQWFVANGSMSRNVCRDLKRARFLWQETGMGIPLKRAQALWEKRGRTVS